MTSLTATLMPLTLTAEVRPSTSAAEEPVVLTVTAPLTSSVPVPARPACALVLAVERATLVVLSASEVDTPPSGPLAAKEWES